jgi:hypothetical protein
MARLWRGMHCLQATVATAESHLCAITSLLLVSAVEVGAAVLRYFVSLVVQHCTLAAVHWQSAKWLAIQRM